MDMKGISARDQAHSLNNADLVHLAAFVIDLALRLEEGNLPLELRELAKTFQDRHTTEKLLVLGTHLRDAYVLHQDDSSFSDSFPFLFWQALADGIQCLLDNRKMRVTVIDGDGSHHGPAPEPRPINLPFVLQNILDTAFPDWHSPEPSLTRQRTVAQFALAIDPFCVEGYFLQGRVAERAHDYQRARIGYERAMEIGALQIGPDAISSPQEMEKRGIVFWSTLNTRPYMRARSSLASLLWQEEDLAGAIFHYRALIDLDASDHQGNRFALLCVLLELGEDEQLASELARQRFYPSPTGEPEDVSDIFWYYTQACRLYRLASTALGDTDAQGRALQALQQAFEENSLVPALLCGRNKHRRAHNGDADLSAEEIEAVNYVSLAQNGWQKTPGALQWMETAAIQAHILPKRKNDLS